MKFKLPKGIKIVKHIDWSKIDFIACYNESHFSDDVWGECAECGKRICWRVYQPQDVKKVCLDCSLKLSKKNTE